MARSHQNYGPIRPDLQEKTSCRLQFKNHLQGTHPCQTYLRLIWYPSMMVEGLSSRLAQKLAQGDRHESVHPNLEVQELQDG